MAGNYGVTLWKKFRHGDNEALSILFQEYYRSLYNYGRRLSGDKQIVMDCIQDLFLNLASNRRNLSEEVNPELYLHKSLRNEIFKVHAKNARLTKLQERWEPDFEFVLEEPDEHPLKNKLNQEIQKLPARQREVLYLKYYRNLDAGEIAAMLSINKQSVYNHLHRALKTLEGVLGTPSSVFLLFL